MQSRVLVLKIDVEGMELDVLHGATEILRKSRPLIIFEAWETPVLNDADVRVVLGLYNIVEFLKQFNYEVFKLEGRDKNTIDDYFAVYTDEPIPLLKDLLALGQRLQFVNKPIQLIQQTSEL